MAELELSWVLPTGIRLQWSDSQTVVLEPAPPIRLSAIGAEYLGPEDMLLKSRHLSEFDTESDRATARANLGLQNIDLGTFQ